MCEREDNRRIEEMFGGRILLPHRSLTKEERHDPNLLWDLGRIGRTKFSEDPDSDRISRRLALRFRLDVEPEVQRRADWLRRSRKKDFIVR